MIPNTSIAQPWHVPVCTALAILGFAAFCVWLICSCYKGDPGYGNTDYPPITETESRKDSGSDAAKGSVK